MSGPEQKCVLDVWVGGRGRGYLNYGERQSKVRNREASDHGLWRDRSKRPIAACLLLASSRQVPSSKCLRSGMD